MNYMRFITYYYYTLNYYDVTFFLNPDKTRFFSLLCVRLPNNHPIAWKKSIHWTFTRMQLCGQIYTQTPSQQLQ